MKNFSSTLTQVSVHLETLAKEKFTTLKKGHSVLEDAVWETLEEIPFENTTTFTCFYPECERYGRYTNWNSVQHLAETANRLNPKFKNYWKTLLSKNRENYKVRVSKPKQDSDVSPKNVYSFLCLDILYVLTLLELDREDLLKEWMVRLKEKPTQFLSPVASLPYKFA
jgi:hypothetical protein